MTVTAVGTAGRVQAGVPCIGSVGEEDAQRAFGPSPLRPLSSLPVRALPTSKPCLTLSGRP